MKTLLVSFILGLSITAYSQTPQQPFSITIDTDKPNVKAGDQVFVNIVMTNTSDRQIDCTGYPSNGLDRNYEYRVFDNEGKATSKVIRKHPEIGETGRVLPCTIKPGESHPAMGGMVSRLFDFSRPGAYSIQVSRHVSSDPRSNVVRSNTITITVLSASQ